MFEIGYSEILITAFIALIVLGPERLPKAARMAGYWVRKARAQWYAVKAELESEIQDEELKRSLKESVEDLRQTLSSHQESMHNEMQALDADIRAEHREINAAISQENNAPGYDESPAPDLPKTIEENNQQR